MLDEVLGTAAITVEGCSLEGTLEGYQEGSVCHHRMEGLALIDTSEVTKAVEDSIEVHYSSNMDLLHLKDITHMGTRLVLDHLQTSIWQSSIH